MLKRAFWLLMVAGLFLLWAAGVYAQQAVNSRPDAEVPFSFTAITTGNSGARPFQIDNRFLGCVNFHLTYANDGFATLSIQIDEAAASSAIPGSWAKYGTAIGATSATLPLTNTTSSQATGFKAVPFVSVNLVAVTGTGTITGKLQCWRPFGGQDANAANANVVNQGNPPWTVAGVSADGAASTENPIAIAGETAGGVKEGVLLDTDGTTNTNQTKIGGSAYALGQAVAASSAPVVLPVLQLPNVGQAVKALSVPVTMASDQPAITISGTVSASNFPATVDTNAGPTGVNTPRTVANQGAPNSLANFWPVRNTDGTNSTPTMDAAARAGFQQGTQTHNNAAPAANNFGVLPALANAAAPSFTEGNQTLFSVDLGGAMRANFLKWGGTALGTPTNFGSTPGSVIAGSVNASLFSGTTALGNTTPGALDSTILPTSTSGSAIQPVPSTATENGHVLKASAGNLYGLTVTSTVNGLVMIFNSTTVPSNGAVTPIYCLRLTPDSGGSGTFGISFLPGPPASFSTGISWAMSTGTNCANLTLSATAWGTGLVK